MEGVEKTALDVGEARAENLNFNPDKRAEISWLEGEDNGVYDPDKGAEISWTEETDNGDNAYNPDKRADVSWPEGELVIPDAPDKPMMELPSGSFCPIIDDGNPIGKLIDEPYCEQVVADFPEESDFGESKTEAKGLTEEEKARLKEETGWSDEIIDSISSMEEARIYQEAGLVEQEVNGKKCLINPDIDMERKDEFGRTNQERMESGLAPLDKEGKPIELHHIGQKNDGPLAELTQEQHRGKDNYSILHDTKKESEIDRGQFDKERSEHWKTRA